MARYRYLIEASGNPSLPFWACTVDATEEARQVGRVGEFATVEEAKRASEESSRLDPNEEDGITWKPAPKGWQPDAVCVSQFFDDGVAENRDD